ncbi:MAG TPA: beta-ketoacyl synthase N-terminal-like domain-containing protein [Candidatus Angelobacter sp.]|jgi:act minimal PKS chain-length factor (CLF/KS beta)|nr:beta-ketoacyl synthase N-terminal-like domain-containing protein [Candidatus Angelobacter sp.]
MRVAITGIGVLTPHGIGADAFWERSCSGQLSLERVKIGVGENARDVVAGRVKDFCAEQYVPGKIIRQTDRSTHMAMAACRLAMEDAELSVEQLASAQAGMYFSTLFGGMEFAEPELYAQAHINPDRVSAYQAIAWFYAATQGQWSILNGFTGYAKTVVADRVGGLQALAWAAMSIEQGHCSIMFAGGFDAPLVPYTMAIHRTSGLLSPETATVESAYRPFDEKRCGTVLAEGAGVLMLEEMDHARARGVRIYAEVAGSGSCCDRGWNNGSCNESRLADCVRDALGRAKVHPESIDHVMAEGLGTQNDDAIEAQALQRVFGACGPTVSAPKSMTGHMLSASGPVDCAWACLMMRHQVLLPTASLNDPDRRYELKHVLKPARASKLNHIVCVGRGYGGTNAAIVLRASPA